MSSSLMYSDCNGNPIRVKAHSIDKIRTIVEKHGIKYFERFYGTSFFRLFKNALINQQNNLCNALIDTDIPIANLYYDSHKKTIFHLACQVPNVNHDILENLLRHGANINAQMSDGCTPLHLSLRADRNALKRMEWANEVKKSKVFRNTKFLIKNGANIDIYNKEGKTPLDFAIDWDNYKAFTVIINREIPVEVENRCLYTIKGLLKKNDFFKFSPNNSLYLVSKYSIINRDLESLKYIMSNTKINFKSLDQPNVSGLLTLAAFEGPQYIKFFIDIGAKPNLHYFNNHCPIVDAIMAENIESIRYLLDCGVSVNCDPDFHSDNSTPLVSAILTQSIEVVEMLLKKGADVNTFFKQMTPLMVACSHQVCKSQHVSYPSHTRKSNQAKIVNLLLDHGADIMKKNEFDQTALTLACYTGDLEIVKSLFSRGLKIERYDNTIIDKAISGGNPDIVKIILEQGVSVNSIGKGTVLERAISLYRRNSTKYKPALKIVLGQIAKMIVTKEYLSRGDRELLEYAFIKKIINETYAKELTSMKKRNISPEFNFSYLDILAKDIDHLGGALEQEELRLVLDEGKYKEEFRYYSKDLENRIEEAIHRRKLVELASCFLQNDVYKNIPFEVSLLIFKSLSITDLNNLLFVS